MDDLEQLRSDALGEIAAAASLDGIEATRIAILGRSGQLTQRMRGLGQSLQNAAFAGDAFARAASGALIVAAIVLDVAGRPFEPATEKRT